MCLYVSVCVCVVHACLCILCVWVFPWMCLSAFFCGEARECTCSLMVCVCVCVVHVCLCECASGCPPASVSVWVVSVGMHAYLHAWVCFCMQVCVFLTAGPSVYVHVCVCSCASVRVEANRHWCPLRLAQLVGFSWV